LLNPTGIPRAASVSLATLKKEVVGPPMVALLAIWLRLLTMVASINLATAKKDGCAKNGPNTDHTWESIGDTDPTWESIGDRHRRHCAPGNMIAFVNYGCVR
jgi:hypothetical protein